MTLPTLPLIGYYSLPSFIGLIRFRHDEGDWLGRVEQVMPSPSWEEKMLLVVYSGRGSIQIC